MEISLAVVSAWLLLAATLLSVGYELWRARRRTGVGPNDNMADWLKSLPLYIGALVVAGLLLVEWQFAPLLGLAYGLLATLASTFWYGPRVLLQRQPGYFDWLEDRLFTILVGLVTFLLACDLAGVSLLA